MGAHLRLRISISIVVAAGALLVAVGVALLLSNTVNLRSSADATIRTDAYLLAVGDVERLVVDAETGLRGYLITGRPLFLAPLHSAQAQLPQATVALQRDAQRDQAFVPQSEAVLQASATYLTGYVPQVLALAAHDLPAARSFQVTLTGKNLVDAVRARTASLQRLVAARQNERQRAAHSSANQSVTEGIIVLVLLTALTVILGVVLGRLAVGQEVARERSERTTRALQQSLLPSEIPEIAGCELAVRFKPAGLGELIGGDFYDAFAVAPRSWAIVVGDVCGKGPGAAAVTAMARWTLRSLSGAPMGPADALRFLNEAMLRQGLDGRFITTAYLLLTVHPDHAHVSIACAGHPAPILVPADGEPTAVAARGTLLGIWQDIRLHDSEAQLRPGDSLIAYTDGVSDQGPGFTPAAPSEMLSGRGQDSSAEQLASLIERYAEQPSGRRRDDVAILVVRFNGEQTVAGARPRSGELTVQRDRGDSVRSPARARR